MGTPDGFVVSYHSKQQQHRVLAARAYFDRGLCGFVEYLMQHASELSREDRMRLIDAPYLTLADLQTVRDTSMEVLRRMLKMEVKE